MIAEAHQHVTADLINRMIDELKGAQAHQAADSKQAQLPSAMEMDSSADHQASAVHTALQHHCRGVPDPQMRKRKLEDIPLNLSKRARRCMVQECMLSDSGSEVEMEYAQ